MVETRPHFFYMLGHHVQALLYMRSDVPQDINMHLLAYARIGLTLLTSEQSCAEFLPISVEKANQLNREIDIWTGLEKDEFGRGRTVNDIPSLHDWVKSFSTTLSDELERVPTFSVTRKGNLSIHSLVKGASDGYPEHVRALLDESLRKEITRLESVWLSVGQQPLDFTYCDP